MKGFSIIICCYNSAGRLKETVHHISVLTPLSNVPFELVIVDNNSNDATVEVVTELVSAYPHLDIVFASETRIGKANAFSKAANICRYDYLIICDDDNLLSEDYLHVAYSIMESDNMIGIVGAQGIIKTEVALPPWFSFLQNAWAVGKQAQSSGELVETKLTVWGAGMVVRKSAWNEIVQKGFTTFLTGRKSDNYTMTGEDSELCILVRRAGYKIFYEEKLRYLHHIDPKRINWENFKKMWEGFSRSSVYFDMYHFYFPNNSRKPKELQRKMRCDLISDFKSLISASTVFLSIKILFITFIEDRPGYLPGLEKRKFFFRLKELFRIRNRYMDYHEIVSNFRG